MSSTGQVSPLKDSDAESKGDALNKLMKSLRSKETKENNSETGSSNGGNNSDNSALVSLGNTSFGFNFDSEEGMSNNSKEGQNDSNEDSDGQDKVPAVSSSSGSVKKRPMHKHAIGSSGRDELESINSSLSSTTNANQGARSEAKEGAANTVADRESIARAYSKNMHIEAGKAAAAKREALERKRKASNDNDTESGGYNSDDDEARAPSGNESNTKGGRGHQSKKREGENKREERNQREKERSFRISRQITELRNLLSSGGVAVPKGTKSSVLTEAANYIRMLQQHQYRSEIERHQLVQQMQLIGGGAHGEQAAQAVRHYAAQNGVWTLGNFGGVPPKSALNFSQPSTTTSQTSRQGEREESFLAQNKVETSDFRFIFNSCGAGMAIASMGGAFIDCNELFCQLAGLTKQEICSLTIFNLTARQDLQEAFDQISRLISPPMTVVAKNEQRTQPVFLRGAINGRVDLGMNVALVKGEDGIAKCFCVTLVKNPVSPFDNGKPVSFDAIHQSSSTVAIATVKDDDDINRAPTFTAG